MGARTLQQAEGAEFLTVRQAAQLVQVSSSTVRTWCRTGRLQRYGEGRLFRVRRSDVIAVLISPNAREVDARADSILGKAGR